MCKLTKILGCYYLTRSLEAKANLAQMALRLASLILGCLGVMEDSGLLLESLLGLEQPCKVPMLKDRLHASCRRRQERTLHYRERTLTGKKNGSFALYAVHEEAFFSLSAFLLWSYVVSTQDTSELVCAMNQLWHWQVVRDGDKEDGWEEWREGTGDNHTLQTGLREHAC